MRSLYFPTLVAVAAIMVMAGTVQALEIFESHFAGQAPGDPLGWSGTDAGATAGIAVGAGSDPGTTATGNWSATFVGSPAPNPGWLTQGSIGGTPTTAKFAHTGSNGRARFSQPMPAGWDVGASGMTVEYGLKMKSEYDAIRGPVQIGVPAASVDGGGASGRFNTYLRVRQEPTGERRWLVVPLRNGGAWWGTGEYVLPDDIGDEWHDWKVVWRYGEYADYGGEYGGEVRNWSLWDVYLDGEHLLFPGDHGSPVFEGQTYSFRTFTNDDVDYIVGLGEVQCHPDWNFEVDYVNMRNVPEPATLVLLALGGLLMRRRRA